MVPLIVLVVVLVIGGGIAFMVKARNAKAAASDEAGIGPNEFLQSPPSSFPSSNRSLNAGDPVAAEAPVEATEPPAAIPIAAVAAELDDEDDDDEVIVARFKAPGARSVATAASTAPIVVPPVYHLEAEPEPVAEIVAETVEEVEAELVAEIAPEPIEAEEPLVTSAPALTLVPDDATDGPVIDLLGESAVVTPAEPIAMRVVGDAAPIVPVAVPDLSADVVDDEAWEDVVLQPEPDAVDHVLQALINRARFKQVEVEAVATELVERADLQGQEVSEVLAELVGRADDTTLDAARTSELTLFNDEVPSRPGQLTDFARLAPTEKKRIIVRVLCLLVARSEDQQLPPRAEGEASEPRSWPLARAVWPLANAEDDGESQLPSRRLAKSG